MSRNDVLVDADWIDAHRDDPNVVLIEVDEDTTAYHASHIRGAIRIDWRTDLQDPLRRDVIDRAGFEALLSANGIHPDDTVILYGGNNNWFAAYAYWYFKLYGHQDVRLLDGGRKRWELDGRDMTADVPQRPATRYVATDLNAALRAWRDEVMSSIGGKDIVDVRSPDEFSGRILAPAHFPQEQPQVPGHVPTAVNVPWSTAANEDGTFKSDEELRALYLDAGARLGDRPTIVYCRIGERSAHTWFVLHELLGVSDVKNYDGSWVEYGSLVGAPVEI
jgi:thiosulfate/3-mercaptopyruvate sulfurtransferase